VLLGLGDSVRSSPESKSPVYQAVATNLSARPLHGRRAGLGHRQREDLRGAQSPVTHPCTAERRSSHRRKLRGSRHRGSIAANLCGKGRDDSFGSEHGDLFLPAGLRERGTRSDYSYPLGNSCVTTYQVIAVVCRLPCLPDNIRPTPSLEFVVV